MGIGATTAIFSVVNCQLLRPLPFPESNRLAVIWERPAHSNFNNVVQIQNCLDWRKRNHSFEDIAAVFAIAMNLDSGGSAVQASGMRVTAGFFEILGIKPLLGRVILPRDDVPSGAPCVTVLSYGLWQRRFGADPGVLSKSLNISETPCEAVGVMPRGFALPTAVAEAARPSRRFRRLLPHHGYSHGGGP